MSGRRRTDRPRGQTVRRVAGRRRLRDAEFPLCVPGRDVLQDLQPERDAGEHAEVGDLDPAAHEDRQLQGRRPARVGRKGGPGQQEGRHRRPVRRDQGRGRRVSPDQRGEPGRGGGAVARLPDLRQRRQRRGPPDPPDVAMVDFRLQSARMTAALARNRAIDLIRAERTRLRFSPDLALQSEWTLSPTVNAMFSESEIADDQLRMMFSCCPPNLPPQAQLGLVLKLLCGFGNGEIAAALLMSEAAVEKQISRGKRTLVRARVLYEVASREQIAKRLESVQRALYLLFSEGYHGSREPVRAGLCGEGMRLCALLTQHPACATPRTLALMALMCFHAARLPGRAAEDGSLLLLEEQDR